MMRQASMAPASFFMFKYLPTALISTLLFGLLCKASGQVAQRASISEPSSTVQQGITIAKGGHCKEALPLLKKATLRAGYKDFFFFKGEAGIRYAMTDNEPDAAVNFLRFLNREFPHDPEVLY